MWSGKRDSNSQPSAWKADALAIELFPPVCRSPLTVFTCLLQPCQLFHLVEGGGFEPPKSHDDRFTVCSLWPLGNSPILNFGAGGRIRTPDLLITNQLLYQLSYTSTISSEVYVTRNVPICQPLNLFFWRFFILRIVRKRWRDLQRAWPAGLCPRCGMELYPGDLDWVLGGRRLCGACAAAWLAEEAERLAAGRKGAVE